MRASQNIKKWKGRCGSRKSPMGHVWSLKMSFSCCCAPPRGDSESPLKKGELAHPGDDVKELELLSRKPGGVGVIGHVVSRAGYPPVRTGDETRDLPRVAGVEFGRDWSYRASRCAERPIEVRGRFVVVGTCLGHSRRLASWPWGLPAMSGRASGLGRAKALSPSASGAGTRATGTPVSGSSAMSGADGGSPRCDAKRAQKLARECRRRSRCRASRDGRRSRR